MKEPKKQISLYIDKELYNVVRNMAKNDSRSVNNKIVMMLRAAVVEAHVPILQDVSERT